MGDTSDKTEEHVTLWAQAMAVVSIKTLVPITLDLHSPNYTKWCGLFKVALCKFALDHHIKTVAASSTDVQWKRMDATILSWLYGSISFKILDIVMASDATALSAWTNIEGLFCDNISVVYLSTNPVQH